MSRPKSIILPLETDSDVCVQAYPDDRDIRVRLPKGGFVRAGLLRHALDKGAPGEVIERGPVTIRVLRGCEMEVEVRLPKGETFSHRFEGDALDEIVERIDQIKALLYSYASDDEAMDRADKKRRESRSHAAAAA